MTFGHLAPLSLVTVLIHQPAAVDGASGFVLMAGLVLGMVQPARLRRGGVSGAVVALLRRAGLLYVTQVATVLLAVLVGLTAWRAPWMPSPDGSGGVLLEVLNVFLLRVNPAYLDILGMYVILLLLAVVALALLVRGLWALVLSGSVVLYVVAQAFPQATTLPQSPGIMSFFNWGAWQLIFLSAFVVGWVWKRHGLRELFLSRRMLLVSVAVFVSVEVFTLFGRFVDPDLGGATEWLIDKRDAGPIRVVMAWAAFVLLYQAVTWLLRRPSLPLIAPLERLGRRSLSSFVVLTLFAIAAGALGAAALPPQATAAVAVVALVGMERWARWRDATDDRPRLVLQEPAP